MVRMRKGHILVDHVSLKVFDLMTAFLETTCVTNLCMGLARGLPGEEVSQRYLPIDPFAFHMIEKTRFVMTFRAAYLPMAGRSPRLHIAIHLVAEATKGRAFREFKKGQRENEECNEADDQRRLYCLGVFLGSLFKI